MVVEGDADVKVVVFEEIRRYELVPLDLSSLGVQITLAWSEQWGARIVEIFKFEIVPFSKATTTSVCLRSYFPLSSTPILFALLVLILAIHSFFVDRAADFFPPKNVDFFLPKLKDT